MYASVHILLPHSLQLKGELLRKHIYISNYFQLLVKPGAPGDPSLGDKAGHNIRALTHAEGVQAGGGTAVWLNMMTVALSITQCPHLETISNGFSPDELFVSMMSKIWNHHFINTHSLTYWEVLF